MSVAAFALLAAVLTGYVLLDGYDLGVGAIHLFYARTPRDRSASFAAIGPFWSGNEVMLIAGGALLFALFPKVYAASFSGFYLPFIIVLWLLMVRGMAIELRGHLISGLWYGFWDAAFAVSSALLALLFGVALGNILRGVPLDSRGYFAGTFGFLLNGYALLVGVFALAALAMYGATFAAWRLRDDRAPRARSAAAALWPFVVVLFVAATAATIRVHPLPHNAAYVIAPAIALGCLVVARFVRFDSARFACAGGFLVALMACAAQTLYPYLLPAFPIGVGGMTIANSSPGGTSLSTAFYAGLIGVGAALVYGTLAARKMLARVETNSTPRA